MSAEFRLDRMGRMTKGPPDLMREWNRMRANIETLERQTKARTLRSSPDVTVVVRPDGTLIRIPARKGGGGAAGTCPSWVPVFRNAGTEGSPDWRVYLTFGTVNGVAPSNWDTEIACPVTGERWPTLTVSTSDGEVSSITWSLESTAPGTDSVSSGAPPTSFAITLGIISDLRPCMAFRSPLLASPGEVFKKSRASLSFDGQEPFERYLRWNISSVS